MGLASTIRPAAMGRTKNRLPWTVCRRVSRKAPSWCSAVRRDRRGKITLVIDRMNTPAITRYRLVEYSMADTPAPSYSLEPNLVLMVRLMGCTQVEIITGPIRAKAFRIPSERKEKSGRYRKSSWRSEGAWTTAWSSQPSR